MTTDEELLTAAQAADRLGVSVRTVARWAEEGRLPEAMKLAGVRGPRLFRAEDVDALAGAA
jgi:excisionase family DNA binding protein